ncbi:hypothetical protein RFI_12954 [Reticulomyxa filosa]|uniref:Uncharacterized protein n=1 Tax=Reticulomyxa filosa TaxID=46433 RepID=X6NE92_RETFI|nr:hypothetical protein RFI_12954 [Reticulomyxa filosa]|eukprot:ETO24208.1 hypothetical protein RFI_12954 [Reticulomyxa filosa]
MSQHQENLYRFHNEIDLEHRHELVKHTIEEPKDITMKDIIQRDQATTTNRSELVYCSRYDNLLKFIHLCVDKILDLGKDPTITILSNFKQGQFTPKDGGKIVFCYKKKFEHLKSNLLTSYLAEVNKANTHKYLLELEDLIVSHPIAEDTFLFCFLFLVLLGQGQICKHGPRLRI